MQRLRCGDAQHAGAGAEVEQAPRPGTLQDVVRIALEVTSFSIKVGFFMWLFVWVRWTLPRFRYDQLMNLGWKVMLPLSLLNIFVTGVLIYMRII